MANSKEIAESIIKQYGNILTAKDVYAYMGVSHNTAKKMLLAVPCIRLQEGSTRKHYLAIDVAKAIAEMQEFSDGRIVVKGQPLKCIR